jgi:predicted nucleotidyltransferase component of viral defense system
MHEATLYPKTKQILDQISSEPFLNHFYLAGGTALALQLGHRKSSDLDWFSPQFPKIQLLLQNLNKYKVTVTQTAPGTLDTLIDGVKVSFLEYTYPMIEKLVPFNGIQMASVSDIACMKITAISSRGSKKDFVDLYEILR